MSDYEHDPQAEHFDPTETRGIGLQVIREPSQARGPKYKAPERRAREAGFSSRELAITGRWIGLLLDEATRAKDALGFWRAAQVLRFLAEPTETQAELAARIGISQQAVSKAVVKITRKLSEISTL